MISELIWEIGTRTSKANKSLCLYIYCEVRTLYAMKAKTDKGQQVYDKATFEGACLDSGAYKSVIVHAQACAYQRPTGRNIRPATDPLLFKFGDGEIPSVGILDAIIPFPNGCHIAVRVHVVIADIPMIFGMEVLCS